MSEYYVLPPSFWINEGLKVEGSLTFINYPNNSLLSSYPKASKQSVYLGIYKLLNNKWELIDVKKVEFGASFDIKRDDLGALESEMIVIVSRYVNDYDTNPTILQQPHSLRLDNAVTAQRASFNLELGQSITSYQSEYPFFLSHQRRSSFMSFDTVSHLSNRPNVECYLMLINVHADSSFKKESLLNIAYPEKPDFSYEFPVTSNSYNLLDCSDYSSSFNYLNPLLLTCSELTFIPLFLLIDTFDYSLSLEHTHPPAELLWGANKYPLIKQMKSSWVSP